MTKPDFHKGRGDEMEMKYCFECYHYSLGDCIHPRNIITDLVSGTRKETIRSTSTLRTSTWWVSSIAGI